MEKVRTAIQLPAPM